MNKHNLKVGNKLYYPNNKSFVTISKIGRIYFECKELIRTKIELETLRDKVNFGHGYTIQLYLSKQEYDDKLEIQKLISKIHNNISELYCLDLDTVKQIYNLIFK